jgi:hypothetical protein
MAITHVVEQGEHASNLAERYGFRSFKTIWNDPANAGLRRERKSPEILYPGDVITIPDRTTKLETAETGHFNQFVAVGDRLELRLLVRDLGGQPRANQPCKVTVAGRTQEKASGEDGCIRVEIPRTAARAVLSIYGESFDVEIGCLDPITEPTGIRARLISLGYLEGPLTRETPESEDPSEIRSAIEEFQCDYGMPVTGDMDDTTRAKLMEVYGC